VRCRSAVRWNAWFCFLGGQGEEEEEDGRRRGGAAAEAGGAAAAPGEGPAAQRVLLHHKPTALAYVSFSTHSLTHLGLGLGPLDFNVGVQLFCLLCTDVDVVDTGSGSDFDLVPVT
jgi:hypothetical protein